MLDPLIARAGEDPENIERAMLFKRLQEDIDAFKARDPAARSRLEILLCYPGLHALLFWRVSSALWRRRFFLLARMVSQLARLVTAVEIHPGVDDRTTVRRRSWHWRRSAKQRDRRRPRRRWIPCAGRRQAASDAGSGVPGSGAQIRVRSSTGRRQFGGDPRRRVTGGRHSAHAVAARNGGASERFSAYGTSPPAAAQLLFSPPTGAARPG
ncbi:MAG: hypothetical protein U1E35_06775 [Rhodospirillales bacterium]